VDECCAFLGASLSPVNVSIPAAATVFREEIYRAPRSWTEMTAVGLLALLFVLKMIATAVSLGCGTGRGLIENTEPDAFP
jgi:hypothetical protein